MNLSKQSMRGVTLIELMVTLAVLAIILTMAIPSFNEFRQRSALRGASDQVVTFWGNARFEALKRNQPIKVGLVRSGNDFCMGAAVATSNTDTAACDCLTGTDCNVAVYPTSQAEWKRILAPASVGKNGDVFAVIDPKRAALGATSQAGFWSLTAPSGGPAYSLNVYIDVFGRAIACEPVSAASKMPQFTQRRCN